MRNLIRIDSNMLASPEGEFYEVRTADYFEAKVHVLGGSQIEVSAKKPRLWREVLYEDLTDKQKAWWKRYLREGGKEHFTEQELAEKKERSLRIAANRAKTRVRKLCKVMQADTMLTLTYRGNQEDLELCKRHLKAFVRRCRVFWPGFTAVSTFEQQKRGAWHVHMAMANIPQSFMHKTENGSFGKVKSFNLIRDQWRRVVGDWGGNIDVARRKRNSRKSPAQIASYLSKYMLKSFADVEAGAHRYIRHGGDNVASPIDLGRFADARHMIAELYAVLDVDMSVVSAVYSPFGDWFFMAAESPHRSRR